MERSKGRSQRVPETQRAKQIVLDNETDSLLNISNNETCSKNYQAMIMTLCVDLAINTYPKKKSTYITRRKRKSGKTGKSKN